MAISFNHPQYLTDLRMSLGEDTSVMVHAAPFTDKEFYRSVVDPGFGADINHLECDIVFRGGTSVIQNVTWKWQMRSVGESTWVDLHSAVTEQWTGGTDTGIRAVLDPASLGTSTGAPFEARVIVLASTAADVSVSIGGAYGLPAIHLFGQST